MGYTSLTFIAVILMQYRVANVSTKQSFIDGMETSLQQLHTKMGKNELTSGMKTLLQHFTKNKNWAVFWHREIMWFFTLRKENGCITGMRSVKSWDIKLSFLNATSLFIRWAKWLMKAFDRIKNFHAVLKTQSETQYIQHWSAKIKLLLQWSYTVCVLFPSKVGSVIFHIDGLVQERRNSSGLAIFLALAHQYFNPSPTGQKGSKITNINFRCKFFNEMGSLACTCNWWVVIIGLDNGLAPVWCQAII